MKILLAEDDHLQASGIKQTLEREFAAQVDVINTESKFASEFELGRIADTGYDVAVIDVMMRWADPAPNMAVPPPEVRRDGFFRAGLRCCDLLRKGARTGAVPVVLFTLLDAKHLPDRPDVAVVEKTADGKSLIAEIRRLTQRAEA